tara:strand:+ start:1269 stop:2954 length:1686 start_codon:yes stop_codon:yes gene_type:complete
MATLKIYDPTIKPKAAADTDLSGITLPLTIAQQEGKAVSSVGQAFANIVNHLGETEDENKVNELVPKVIKKVNEEYNKYSSTSDTVNSPLLFEKALSSKSKWFAGLVKNQNKRVQRNLKEQLGLKKNAVLTDLINQVSTNSADKFLANLDSRVNSAITNILSGDQSAMGIGEIEFNSILTSEVYEEKFGSKEWREFVKKKKLQFFELAVERENIFNPSSTIVNQEKLIDKFGLEKTNTLVEDAKTKLVSKMAEKENAAVIEELRDNNSKVAVFTEFLLRLKIDQESVEDMEQDLPTVADLQTAMDEGLITEPMFFALSSAIMNEDKISDQDVLMAVTEQLASANSVQIMSDLKLAASTDPRILNALNLGDLTLVHNLIDGAKKNFKAHKETQHYLRKIKAHYKNLSSADKDMLGLARTLEDKKEDLERNYLTLVANGYSAKSAYIDTIKTEFDQLAIPALNNMEQAKFLTKTPDYQKQIIDRTADVYFKELYDEALEAFKKHKNHLQFQTDINRVDMIERMFWLRYSLATPNDKGELTHEMRVNFATQADATTSGDAYAWE